MLNGLIIVVLLTLILLIVWNWGDTAIDTVGGHKELKLVPMPACTASLKEHEKYWEQVEEQSRRMNYDGKTHSGGFGRSKVFTAILEEALIKGDQKQADQLCQDALKDMIQIQRNAGGQFNPHPQVGEWTWVLKDWTDGPICVQVTMRNDHSGAFIAQYYMTKHQFNDRDVIPAPTKEIQTERVRK